MGTCISWFITGKGKVTRFAKASLKPGSAGLGAVGALFDITLRLAEFLRKRRERFVCNKDISLAGMLGVVSKGTATMTRRFVLGSL
jgi:hypothetical protein